MSLKIESAPSPNHSPRSQTVREIVAHWWDDPAKNPSLGGTVSWLRNPASQVSAHYVVSGDRIIRLVDESRAAWHAGNANPFTIGIEIDPNVPGNTYKTVGWLVKDIRNRRGKLALVPHNKYSSTRCPGSVSLSKIEQAAKGGTMEKVTSGDIKNLWPKFFGQAADQAAINAWSGKSFKQLVYGIAESPVLKKRLSRTIDKQDVLNYLNKNLK